LKRILPRYRVEDSHSRKTGGVGIGKGIGQTIAYRLPQAHGTGLAAANVSTG
jgi:signal transduction histidine kinase